MRVSMPSSPTSPTPPPPAPKSPPRPASAPSTTRSRYVDPYIPETSFNVAARSRLAEDAFQTLGSAMSRARLTNFGSSQTCRRRDLTPVAPLDPGRVSDALLCAFSSLLRSLHLLLRRGHPSGCSRHDQGVLRRQHETSYLNRVESGVYIRERRNESRKSCIYVNKSYQVTIGEHTEAQSTRRE